MTPDNQKVAQNGQVRISPDTTISLGLLVAIVGMILALVVNGIETFARSEAALSREQAALSYLSKAEANDRFQSVQSQMDRRFTGIEKSLCRIEEKIDKHSAEGR